MARVSLVLAFCAGAVLLPRLLAAETILTQCGCPPASCPSGYTEFASGTTPLASGCSGGCAGGVSPWWRQCTQRGDGYCRTDVENGSNAPEDCCDENTPCNQIRATSSDEYCRRFKTGINGTWGPWQWITPASYNSGCCSDAVNHLCSSYANCASTEAICANVSSEPHWKVLPASCP